MMLFIHKLRQFFSISALAIIISTVTGNVMSADDEDLQRLPPSNESPTVSPDGRHLLFVSDATGKSTIWIANRDGSQAKPFLNWLGSVQKDPDWAPDGGHVVFASNFGGVNFDIWSVDSNGANPIKLTSSSGSNQQPRYSPDGMKIAFTSDRTGKRELWYMGSNGSAQKAVGLQSLIVSDPTWSPDGTSLAYVGCTRPANGESLENAPCNLFVITLDASSARKLTDGAFRDWEPDWSSAGIVFSSSRGGGQGLWTLDPSVNGALPETVPSDGNGMDTTPRWDKLTSEIVFGRTGIVSDIWSTTASGRETRLTNVVGFSRVGDVNADGAVTCADISLVRLSFGKRSTQAGYDLRADLNGDGVVNVRDLSTVSSKLPAGTTCK